MVSVFDSMTDIRNTLPPDFDLISGKAGAVIGLLILRNILDDASLLDFAEQLGNELIQSADKAGLTYSWKAPTILNQRNLTGLSHGTAGVGYALLELYRATGNSIYKKSAEFAFQYERHFFDAEAGNWPDFRKELGSSNKRKHSLNFATSWCHGAPGIAMSRLRAYEILKDSTYKAEAIVALQTTRKMIETSIQSGTENYSLCHGLSGNAEALLYGTQVLGQEWLEGFAVSCKIGNIGIDTYAKHNRPWPCGTYNGQTPNLMLGLAGIGYYYLRLHNSAVPSILLLRGV